MSHLRFAAIWLLCLIAALVSFIWLTFGILKPTSRRAWRIAVGFDQTANAAFGGDEDETISSRAWRLQHRKKWNAIRRLIDFAFNDPSHCRNAYQHEIWKAQNAKR